MKILDSIPVNKNVDYNKRFTLSEYNEIMNKFDLTHKSKFNNKQEIKDFCNAHNIKIVFSRTLGKNSHRLIYESYNHFIITIKSENYQIEKQLFSPFINITVSYQ